MFGVSRWHTVRQDGDIVGSEVFKLPITRDWIALHHYEVKSREYEKKMHRGNTIDDPKRESFWDVMENIYPHVDCLEIAKYDP